MGQLIRELARLLYRIEQHVRIFTLIIVTCFLEDPMKYLFKKGFCGIIFLFVVSGFASAAQGAEGQGGSLLLSLFVGFFALIVVFQLVPACLLFLGMLKSLFARQRSSDEKKFPV